MAVKIQIKPKSHSGSFKSREDLKSQASGDKSLHSGSNKSRNDLKSQASGNKRLHSGSNKLRNDLKRQASEENVSIQAVINQEMLSKVRPQGINVSIQAVKQEMISKPGLRG